MCWKVRLQDKKQKKTQSLNTVIKYYFAACGKRNQQKCWAHTDASLLSPHTAALRHTHSNMIQRSLSREATRFRRRRSLRRRWLKWSYKGTPAPDNESDCKCIHASRWRENSRAAASLSNDCASFTVCKEEGEIKKQKQKNRHRVCPNRAGIQKHM